MSKYKKSVFPYSVHSTPNLYTWRPKDTNVTIKPCSRLFTPHLFTFSRQLLPKEFSFQSCMSNFVKIDDICKEFSTSHFVTYLPKLELVFL